MAYFWFALALIGWGLWLSQRRAVAYANTRARDLDAYTELVQLWVRGQAAAKAPAPKPPPLPDPAGRPPIPTPPTAAFPLVRPLLAKPLARRLTGYLPRFLLPHEPQSPPVPLAPPLPRRPRV